MKKRVLSIVSAMILSLSIFGGAFAMDVQAEDNTVIDGSYLTTDTESSGEMVQLPKGIYLRSGISDISKAGSGLVTAYGATYAQQVVSSVSVNVILERLSGGSWVRVTSWSATNYNTTSVNTSKNVSVGSGYYYRVRSIHSANSESSSSSTNGLYI